MGQGGEHQIDGAEEIHRHRLVEVLDGCVRNGHLDVAAGVGDDDVEAFPLRDGRRYQRFHLAADRDVGGNGEGRTATGGDLRCQFTQGCGGPGGECHTRTGRRQCLCRCPTDAARCPGDDGDLLLEEPLRHVVPTLGGTQSRPRRAPRFP